MRAFLTVLSLCLLGACAQRGPVKNAEALPPAHVDLAARGRELAKAGDYVRAEQYLAGALEAGGEVDAILPALLRVCVASERYEAALAYTERYEPEASDSSELELVLAALQLGLGQVENARRSLELVLKQKPEPQAHYLLGELYYHALQDYGAADEHYRAYLALAPTGRFAPHVRRLLLKSPDAPPDFGPKAPDAASASDVEGEVTP